MRISPNKTGLALGGFLGLFHAAWAALVALDLAQVVMDFVFELHMIHPVYTVGPFSVMTAASLVVMTAVMGYVFGYIFAWLWNRVH